MSSAQEALDELLRPGERVVTTVNASPATSNKTVFFGSLLALTTERVLEVSTSTRAKLGIGKGAASSVSVALADISGCDFRKGKLLWKNGGKNLVVVQTPQGERAWATMNPQLGQEFTEKVNTQLGNRR